MKNWYNQLKKRAIVHIILVLINVVSFFIIGASDENANIGFFAISWLTTGMFEIVFLIFEAQLRLHKTKPLKADPPTKCEKSENVITTTTVQQNCVETDVEKTQKASSSESKKDFHLYTEHNGVKYALKYVYRENLCFVENIDKVTLEDNDITYHLESDNKYDPNTIAVYVGDTRIGLMYKGNCRDIITKCLRNGKYEVSGFICKLDIENNQIAIKVGFFMPIESRKSFTTSIIKTSKKDMFDNRRQDNVDCLNEGDLVYFSEDYESDGLLVTDEYGNELGEISESATEKINDDTKYIDKIIGIVEEISYNDSGKTKAKVRIYLTEEK